MFKMRDLTKNQHKIIIFKHFNASKSKFYRNN